MTKEEKAYQMRGCINYTRAHSEISSTRLANARRNLAYKRLCNPVLVEKPIKKSKRQINSEEKRLLSIVEQYGFEYFGNRETIGRLRPDFINKEKKLIIEYNGCYWHGCHRCYPNGPMPEQNDDTRKAKFWKEGYSVLVVTTHNMQDMEWDPVIFKNVLDALECKANELNPEARQFTF